MIVETIQSYGVPDGTSSRFDCPECGGRKTLSITNRGDELLWNCFHASCSTRGRTERSLTVENALESIQKRINPHESSEGIPFERPAEWSRKIPDDAKKYFDSVHITGRYHHLYHDVRRNRAVIAVHDFRGNLVDGVGRTLEGSRPKWYRYGNYAGGFAVGKGNTLIVVEDAPSAISISDWCVGYALLGTSLREAHVEELARHQRVVVALDKDATDKALDIATRMAGYGVDVDLMILTKDLKAMEEDARERLIQQYI